MNILLIRKPICALYVANYVRDKFIYVGDK